MSSNIVFIAEEGHFKNWSGKSYYDLITYVRDKNEKYNIRIYWTDDNVNRVTNEILQFQPSLIFYFATGLTDPYWQNIFNLNIPFYTLILDMFYSTRICLENCYKRENFKGIIHIGKCQSIIDRYKNEFPDKQFICLDSRFINVDRFKDYGLEKKYDILIYGTREFFYPYKKENLDSINRYIEKYEKHYHVKINDDDPIEFYPLRNKLEKIINKLSDRYNVKIVPAICIIDANIANEDLSMLINQSYLCVACPTIVDLMMHKYLEISASNCAILGKCPGEEKELFEGNIVEVDEFMEDDEIIRIIDDALSNKKKLLEMSSQLYKRVHEEHNFNRAVENFNRIIDSLITNL